ncbi:MAG TPA: ATP-binding protein [Solirubrobacterales bacterium]|nr:ATP-binding protein [Solirubrobacterales bacterium]
MLRELAGILFGPAADPRAPARTGVSVERTARVSGLQALLVPLVTAPLLLIVEPTGPIGDAGWALALGGIASVVAIGAFLVRAPTVSPAALGGANAFTAAVLGMLAWLTGGFDSPFLLIFPLLASSITPHTPHIRRLLLAWLLLAIASPFLYEDAATTTQVAEMIMIASVSVATLLTMVWVSTQVGRAETGLIDAVTTATVAREALEEETERLFELSEQRDRLVTRVSHELRTPLTSVKGYVEALLEGEGGELDPAQRELAAVALRNAVRLEHLIADLLLLSRVEAGQLELRAGQVEIRGMIDLLARDLEQLARESRVTLVVEVEPGLEWSVDRERLEQAITNLVSNAIKYSPEGGPVLIRARQAASELWIEIVDKGVGVPKEEIGQLGERFFRASTAGEASGTGLGISITKELIELHGGWLEVESKLGSGSIFRLRLPPVAGSTQA